MSEPRDQRWRRLAGQRWPWVLLLLAQALAYYASYVRYGVGFRDEGQTVAFLAQRLLQGETPLKDVVLNYNVLWFYPVVWLYQFFGVNYVLLRGYCFALSTLTALLGFILVEKTTRRPWLAWLVATVLVLIPGSTFKNYIPLLALANTLCLLHAALAPPRRRTAGLALVGGVVLGLTFLIRIDIAVLFAVIWLGLLALRLSFGETSFKARAGDFSIALLALTGSVVLVHWPAWHEAQRRGFAPEFVAQYQEKLRMFSAPAQRLLRRPAPAAVRLQAAAPVPAPLPTPTADKKTLARASLENRDPRDEADHAFLLLTYAPFVSLLVLVPWGLATWIAGLRHRAGEQTRRGLAVLVLLGGALTTFPQFFFFRPDIPHLSEFMPGFLTATVASAGLLCAGLRTWKNWRTLILAFLLLHIGVYLVRVLPDRWAGTWTIRSKRTKFFTAENGVRVFVTSRELQGLTKIQQLLHEHASAPRDYVVCYPYSPGINLLANRPTYERNVYVDNATRTTRWDDEAIARFEKFQPAVIVLSDWDINGSPSSRFSVWAVRAKTWIQTHYLHQGTYLAGPDAFEIYTRPPGLAASPLP